MGEEGPWQVRIRRRRVVRPAPSSSFCEARRIRDSCRTPPSAADDWKQEPSGLEASSSLARGGFVDWEFVELNCDRDGMAAGGSGHGSAGQGFF